MDPSEIPKSISCHKLFPEFIVVFCLMQFVEVIIKKVVRHMLNPYQFNFAKRYHMNDNQRTFNNKWNE